MIKIPNNYSGNGFITTIEGQKFGKYIQDSVNLNSGFSNFSTAISPFGENLCKPFPDSIIFSMSTKHIYLYKTDTICKNGTIEGFYYCNDVSPDSNQFFYGEVFLKTLTTDTINCFRNSLRCAYKSSYIHDVHSIVNSIKRN